MVFLKQHLQDNSQLRRWQSIIAFFLVAILLGSIPPVTKFVVTSISPTVLLSTRYLIAVFLFIPFILKTLLNISPIKIGINHNPTLPIISNNNIIPTTNFVFSRDLLKDGLLLGFITFGIHLCLSFGVQMISANRASFLFGLSVIFISVLDLIYRKRFSPIVSSAAIISFGGSGLISWEQSQEPITGTLWLLGAIFCEISLLILLEDIAPRHDSVMLSMIRLSIAAILALFLSLPQLSDQINLIMEHWMPLLYLGIATATTSWLVIFALQTLTATEASLIQALEPVFGAIISFILLGEVFGWRGLVGSGIILIATILTILTISNGLSYSNKIEINSEESKL